MLLVVVFLATDVQSRIISGYSCVYNQTDTTCTEGNITRCFDMCEGEDIDCDTSTCDEALIYYHAVSGTTSWDSCYFYNNTVFPTYVIASCEDDGTSPCDGYDLCVEICFFSNTGTCNGPCVPYWGLQIPGFDCDDYRENFTNAGVGFTDFEECYTVNISGTDVEMYMTGCPKASASSSTNVGLIVGLVVGGVVLIIAVLALMHYMNNRKKLAAVKNTIETEGE